MKKLFRLSINCKFIVILSCLHFSQNSKAIGVPVANYKSTVSVCYRSSSQDMLYRLRKMMIDGREMSLVADPKSLQTMLVESKSILCNLPNTDGEQKKLIMSNYRQVLAASSAAPFPLKNDGLTHSIAFNLGSVISIDLCPSHKALDRDFFKQLTQLRKTRSLPPLPLAISVSGLWMDHHLEDLQWLMNLNQRGDFNITWMNHSLTHPYVRGLPDEKNFLLKSGINFESEVLDNENKMIRLGIVPSIFFRFPGLVSNEELMKKLTQMGLVAIGANAWIAKGEKITPGSVILLHGNGNERIGLTQFLNWFSKTPNWQFFSVFDLMVPQGEHSKLLLSKIPRMSL